MLEVCIVLLVVGILAIVLEMLMPGFDGFISGIIGILALVASAVLAVIQGYWFFVILTVATIAVLIFLLFSFIKRKQYHGKIMLNENLDEDLPQIDLSSLIGKEGKTMTKLRPYGEADFGGVRVEVCSDGSMIERGAKITVIETQSNKVIVSEVNSN